MLKRVQNGLFFRFFLAIGDYPKCAIFKCAIFNEDWVHFKRSGTSVIKIGQTAPEEYACPQFNYMGHGITKPITTRLTSLKGLLTRLKIVFTVSESQEHILAHAQVTQNVFLPFGNCEQICLFLKENFLTFVL